MYKHSNPPGVVRGAVSFNNLPVSVYPGIGSYSDSIIFAAADSRHLQTPGLVVSEEACLDPSVHHCLSADTKTWHKTHLMHSFLLEF